MTDSKEEPPRVPASRPVGRRRRDDPAGRDVAVRLASQMITWRSRPMNADGPGPTIDLITIPRTVLSVMVGVVHTLERALLGEAHVRTARGNAWDAICADRARARQRDEVRRVVAALATPGTGGDGRDLNRP